MPYSEATMPRDYKPDEHGVVSQASLDDPESWYYNPAHTALMSRKKHLFYYRGLLGGDNGGYDYDLNEDSLCPRLVATSSRDKWKYESSVLDTTENGHTVPNDAWAGQRLVPLDDHRLAEKYEEVRKGEELSLREKVRGVLYREKVPWETIDVCRVEEDVHWRYRERGSAKEVKGRPVVLVTMTWPSTGEREHRVVAERLDAELQGRCQSAVDGVRELMVQHGMPDVHCELKEGCLRLLGGRKNAHGKPKLSVGHPEKVASKIKEQERIVEAKVEVDEVVESVVKPARLMGDQIGLPWVEVETDDETEDEPKWKWKAGCIFAFVKIRGEGYLLTAGHIMPKWEKDRKQPEVKSRGSKFGELVCSFENEVGPSGGLRDWALVKLDPSFKGLLPLNQAPDLAAPTIYTVKKPNHDFLIRAINPINTPKSTPTFFPFKIPDQRPKAAASSTRNRKNAVPVAKYSWATGWTIGMLNNVASDIRLPSGHAVTCLAVLNYHGRQLSTAVSKTEPFCYHGDSGAMVQTLDPCQWTTTSGKSRKGARIEGGQVVGMLVAGAGLTREGGSLSETGEWNEWVERISYMGYVVPVGEMLEDIKLKLELGKKEEIGWF